MNKKKKIKMNAAKTVIILIAWMQSYQSLINAVNSCDYGEDKENMK